MKLGVLLVLSTSVAALGGLLLGFDTAVIAGATHGITQQFQLTPASLGFTVSFALWGTILGGLLAAIPGERYGSRDSLRVMAILYLVSALGCAFAPNWGTLLIFRFIGGLGIGGTSVFGPMYIADIAPARWRGRLVSCFQLAIVLGILLAYAWNYTVSLFHPITPQWRWELGIAAAPAGLFFCALFSIPRSPRWLVKKGRIEEASRALEKMRELDPPAKLETIQRSLYVERQHQGQKLFTRRHLFPIFLAISVGVFNQLSGINAILYYLNDIFAQAGFSRMTANAQAVAIGAANLVFTVLAMSLIDRMGRKFLLLIGSAGMAACLAAVSFIFFSMHHQRILLSLLLAYIAFFAFSQGTVVWVYLSEVFPAGIREKGQSLGTFFLWLMNALVAGTFPKVASFSRGTPFLFFSVVMTIQFFVVLLVFPETKGVSLEDAAQYVA